MYPLPPKHRESLKEIGAILRLKGTRRARRDKALDALKTVVSKCHTKGQLYEVLVGIGMFPATAKALTDAFSVQRIREVIYALGTDVMNVTGFIRKGLEKGWKFTPST